MRSVHCKPGFMLPKNLGTRERFHKMSQTIRRLQWGCGSWTPQGWINSDIKASPGVDLPCDIMKGLPLDEGSIDYAVSIHALPEIHFNDQLTVLAELRRVLKTGGVLRLALPDLMKGVRAFERGDRDYFLVPDEDAVRMGAKFITQLIWYGYSRTLFVPEFIEELLLKAGFSHVSHCQFKQTASSFEEIVALDNREAESLFVEASK
jgi:SAM-dependent methyltransferase